MKYLFALLLFSLIMSSTIAQFVGLNNKEVASLKSLIKKDPNASTLYEAIKKVADSALNEKPNPIDKVVSEGHLATDPKKIQTVRSLKDIELMHSLSVAYKVEGSSSYLKKFTEFISAWAEINEPEGNPINDTKFDDVFMSYDLVKADIPPAVKQGVDRWLAKMADEEINTANKKNRSGYNNWNSHRLMVIGSIAYILDSPVYKKYIDVELPLQISKNLLPDGTGIDLLERDAMHYHIYTLEPLINLATTVKRATGKDYYHYVSPTGSSMKKSVDFLLPFVTGEKIHPEFVKSKVAFDRKRAENKEPGYQIGAPFQASKGIPVIIQAAYFEPTYVKLVKKITGDKKDYFNWQAVLNAVKK